mgnify:CR=1 FL=1
MGKGMSTVDCCFHLFILQLAIHINPTHSIPSQCVPMNTKPQYNVQFEVECNLSLPFHFWSDDEDLESDSGSDSATTESNPAISSTPGASSIPQESISVSDYTTAIQASATVYGSSEQTAEIRAMNHNTGKCSKTFALMEDRFFEALSRIPKYHGLLRKF